MLLASEEAIDKSYADMKFEGHPAESLKLKTSIDRMAQDNKRRSDEDLQRMIKRKAEGYAESRGED